MFVVSFKKVAEFVIIVSYRANNYLWKVVECLATMFVCTDH